MTVVFSTSSPLASVALFEGGRCLGAREMEAPMAASGACLTLLDSLLADAGRSLAEVRIFAADTGPGSFTGVKVGVVLAKTLAFAVGASTASLSSFDLIDAEKTVAIPSRKGEWFVRSPGITPEQGVDHRPVGALGYGSGVQNPIYPHAERSMPLISGLATLRAVELLPAYLAEPSISTPKTPYRIGDGKP